MSPGQVRAHPGPGEMDERAAVESFCVVARAQQRPAARDDAERPVGAARVGLHGQRGERAAGDLGHLAPRGRLDQLDQGPVPRGEFPVVAAGPVGRDDRLLVLAQAVEQQRLRPAGDGDRQALAVLDRVGEGGLDHRRYLGLVTAPGGQGPGDVGREVRAGGVGDRLQLREHRRGGGQLTREQVHVPAVQEGERKLAERAGLPGKLDVPRGQAQIAVVVPDALGGDARHPQRAHLLLLGHVAGPGGPGGQPAPEERRRGGVPVVEVRGQPDQEKIRCPKRVRRPRGRADDPGHVPQSADRARPGGPRTSPPSSRRGRFRGTASGRPARAGWPRRAAAGRRRCRGSWRTRSGLAPGPGRSARVR